MKTTKWIAEVFMNGRWLTVAECDSKFVASLATVKFELAGVPVRLTEKN